MAKKPPSAIVNPDIDVAKIGTSFNDYTESDAFPANGDLATVYARGFRDGVRYARSMKPLKVSKP